jgi:WD40 repeat protein
MHPDGLIYGLGQENGVVQIYDLKTQQMAFKVSHFSDPVTGIKFSENGYHMVVYSTDAGVVNFYDLRKVTETEDMFYSMNVPQVNKVKFDKSGKYVGISTLESIR